MKRKPKKLIIKPLSNQEAKKKVRKSLPKQFSQVKIVPDKKTTYKRKLKHPTEE